MIFLDLNIPLYRNVYIRQIVKDEVNHWFVPVFSEKLDERLGRQDRAQLVSSETVLCKHVIIFVKHL